MPLSAGFGSLPGAIEAAYKKAKDAGADENNKKEDIIKALAEDLGAAIHDYMSTAMVTTMVTIDPGQACAAPGISSTPGSYSGPGSGFGTGGISFEGGDADALKAEIEAAFVNVEKAGNEDGADPDGIIDGLAAELAAATHKFALTAKVETDVTILPGVAIVGYIAMAGAPPPPIPSVSLAGTGTGEGSLS